VCTGTESKKGKEPADRGSVSKAKSASASSGGVDVCKAEDGSKDKARVGVKKVSENSLDVKEGRTADRESAGKRKKGWTDEDGQGQRADKKPAKKRMDAQDSRGSNSALGGSGKGEAKKQTPKRTLDWKAKGPAALCMEALWAFDQVMRRASTAFALILSRSPSLSQLVC
jgi:hypothetical protein